jgi:phosphopantothenoylcysteine decarboxylase / phosphopantothenate---cysteine ligase
MARFDDARVIVAAAAAADFTPHAASDQKIKKSERMTLELDKAVDILEAVGKKSDGKVLVGFAAETTNLIDCAKQKLAKKNLDLIVANDVSPANDPFGSDTNQVTFISATGETIEWPRMSKREIADAIFNYVRDHFLEGLG